MGSVDAMEENSYENRRTPQPWSSCVTISDAMNAFSELHLLDTPKSSNYVSTRLASNPRGSQSRLNAETKRRTLFHIEKPEKLKWTHDEVYALVLFTMLYTDGKQWATHKDTKFWNDAGIFVQQHSGSSHCRTGNAYRLAFVTVLKVLYYQVYLVGQGLPKYL